MPAAIGFFLFTVGAQTALVNFVTIGFGATLLSLLGPVALTFAANAFFSQKPQQKPSDGQQEFKQAVPPRFFHYGRVKVGGPLAFYETVSGGLYKLIMISAREIDAIETVYLNNRPVAVNGSNQITSAPYVISGNFYASCVKQLGTDTQVANPLISTAFPSAWDSTHRLRGIANLAFLFNSPSAENFPAVFTNGEPQGAALIRGSKLYDPRKDSTVIGGSGAHRFANKATWEWSDNAGLAVLDYLTYADGYNRAIAKIDLASFQAFANVCDQAIALGAGGSEARYRVATTVSLADQRKDVLARLLTACDGQLYTTATGTIGIRGGIWETPTVTIDHAEGHILQARFSPVDAVNRYTILAIQYLSTALDYIEDQATDWRDETAIAATGIEETQTLDLSQVPSATQARRLAKIKIIRDNPDWIVQLQTNLYGLNCIGERVITLIWPELGIEGPFYVESAPSLLDDMTGVSMVLRSARSVAYDWTTLEEGSSTSLPPDTGPDLELVPPAITVSEIAVRVIHATWTPSGNLGISYEVRYRADPGSVYTAMTVSSGRDSADSGTVAAGLYQVSARSLSFSSPSAWSAESGITIT